MTLVTLQIADDNLATMGRMPYPKVPTAEKRAQLAAAGEEWPTGEDGLPMRWHARDDHAAGGRWELRASHNAASRQKRRTRYATDAAFRDRERVWQRERYAADAAYRERKRDIFTPTYISWMNMKQRCLNPNDPAFNYYGGRGITVCERWLTYANFLADMGERPPGTTLDRINNDGDYEPGNCRWATPKQQRANQRKRLR